MPKYEVTMNETLAHSVRVWAVDTDEALKRAYDIIMNNPATEYYTESLGTNENGAWVEEIKGDD
jgi:hypothetical protein